MGWLSSVADRFDAAAQAVLPQRRQAARNLLATFAADTKPPAWPGLPRAEVADRLLQLVTDPSKVQQGRLGVCGPAAFVRCWAARDPAQFVQFAIDLYTTGTARLGELTMTPNDRLRKTDYDSIKAQLGFPDGTYRCEAGEWMVMSTIQDNDNALLDYYGLPSDGWQLPRDGSPDSSVKKWLNATNLYKSVDNAAILWNSMDDLRKLAPDPSNDIILDINVTLLVDAPDLTHKVEEWLGVLPADHFVRLTSQVRPAAADPANLDLDIWCWGQPIAVQNKSPDWVSARYHGAIIARAK
jgi:hypothetical protein